MQPSRSVGPFSTGHDSAMTKGRARNRPTRPVSLAASLAAAFGAALSLLPAGVFAQTVGETWRGLAVSPEHRCTPYSRQDYPYPQSVEKNIVAEMGGRIYGPYTGRYFGSTKQTDIEHIVAVSEAHDSGLCGADSSTRRRFASDTLNLTLAVPAVNRCGRDGKCHHDAAEWLPPMNRCWFAGRIVAVKRKYGLTVDGREAAALESVLSTCGSTDMVFAAHQREHAPADPVARSSAGSAEQADALGLYDDNRNGRITCKEARRHGIAPVRRGHPAYRFMRDGDGDGVVCE